MNKKMFLVVVVSAVLAFSGIAQAAGELNFYNWGNYTNPKLIKKFEAEYDIKVTITDYDSNATMLAGIKPTVGRVSRWGVIPITADQDTAGPMARTVTDAAIMLGALEGTGPDPNDPATSRCEPPPDGDYTAFLHRDALEGARIGVPRALYYEPRCRSRTDVGRTGPAPRARTLRSSVPDAEPCSP